MTQRILDDEDSGSQRRHETRRREDHAPPPSIAKQIGIALAVLSLGGSVFTAGYNWRSVAILEVNQEQFVRKDVQQEQLRNINDRLYEISKQLEQVRGELEVRRRQLP